MTEDNTLAVEQEKPPLKSDSAFWGMTGTQFLGAFNDNLFKQLVLLLCIDALNRNAESFDYQAVAQALFAIPFVLFSGFGGFLSDRYSKRTIVVLCKVAEIAVMVLGMIAFSIGRSDPDFQLQLLLCVLFLMGTQSAFFGPSKYGILPEMLNEPDLPQANGVIQMTTFLAIIFGTAVAGYSKDGLGDAIWIIGAICTGIAVVGTATSLLVRRTPIAHPGLKFEPSALAIKKETARMLLADRPLLGVLLISSLFWFIGGVVQTAVNEFGRTKLQFSDSRTSLMASCMGLGIAIGCVWAGRLSHHKIDFRLVTRGAWGIVVSLLGLTVLGYCSTPLDQKDAIGLVDVLMPVSSIDLLGRLFLTGLGISAGLFAVPLAVFMQARPPKDQKGRMIGAMNLINWIGILMSAAFFLIASALLRSEIDDRQQFDVHWVFAALAVVMLPVAIWYRPKADAD